MNEKDSIEVIKGIGEKSKKIFEQAGITSIGDLLCYYPRAYDRLEEPTPIGELTENNLGCIVAVLDKPLAVRYVKKFQMTSGILRDESGTINVTWFRMPYLKNTLKIGARYVFRGRITRKGTRFTIEQPAMFDIATYFEMKECLQPCYPLVKGLTNKMVMAAVRKALNEMKLTPETLPIWIRERYHLAEFHFAIEQIHFPKDEEHLHLARHRLVFDEFFFFILALQRMKESRLALYHNFRIKKTKVTDKVIAKLEFSLTAAQEKVWQEIETDLVKTEVMARLIQGDVGSGKTIIALLALLLVVKNGYQGSLMVPTEVLARQHYESITALLHEQELDFQVELLTGSMTAKEKRKAYERIANGAVNIIIGTHALIQEKVIYQNLALVITDEQHRFGVKQREAFAGKGATPHTLVMSATPIPRTLAVILYGDLDISVIDELPANRQPIKNCVVGISYRQTAYTFIEGEIRSGRQAYIICPMVEESEVVEAENVIEYTENLKHILAADICIEYLHGKMKPKEKNAIMERFLQKEIQVLVSTTVVEVGVNVPNATVMMIENAERFGLAQLHQLRGRVGRGKHQSYCIMVYGTNSKRTRERLEVLNHSNDGFYIANEDLKMRGPGDLFGIRQSGLLDFKIGDVFQDARTLQEANEALKIVLTEDPELETSQNCMLQQQVARMIQGEQGSLNL